MRLKSLFHGYRGNFHCPCIVTGVSEVVHMLVLGEMELLMPIEQCLGPFNTWDLSSFLNYRKVVVCTT